MSPASTLHLIRRRLAPVSHETRAQLDSPVVTQEASTIDPMLKLQALRGAEADLQRWRLAAAFGFRL